MPAPFREQFRRDGREQAPPVSSTLGEDLAGPLESALVRTGITSWIENDFERVVFPQHPSLAEIKRILLGSGTPEAALPCFAVRVRLGALRVVPDPRRCGSGTGRLKQRFQETEVRSTLTRTLPRKAYWSEMLLK